MNSGKRSILRVQNTKARVAKKIGAAFGANLVGRRFASVFAFLKDRYEFFQFLPLLAMLFPILFPYSLTASVTTSTGVVTNPLNLDPAVRQAYNDFYILDYAGALAGFKKIESEHPGNPLAVDYVLNVTLFQELYRLDLLDTTFYAHDGFLTGKHAAPTPDAQVETEIGGLAQDAVSLADHELQHDPQDVDALFARGWARSLDALYTGLVKRSYISALHLALQARDDNERVLKLDPAYQDAKLVVGVHEYIVGSLPLTFKIIAGAVGIKGSKKQGMRDLEETGKLGVITSVEARTALSLFLRREADYTQAKAVMQSLCTDYPRDFLFCLEVANLTKDDGEGNRAIDEYTALLQQSRQPGYFPSAHLELAWFGLAEAFRGQKHYHRAAAAYDTAASQRGSSSEVRARAWLNAGEMYDLLNQTEAANRKYREVLDTNPGTTLAESAEKYMKSPFAGQ